MHAVVLAGGLGTRLRARVSNLPKPMAPVAGRPFLEFVLSGLAHQGVTRVILSTGYLAATIVDHFGDRFESMSIEYSEEPEPLGTGGAVKMALDLAPSDPFLLVNGDTSVPIDVPALERAREVHAADLVMTLCQVGDVARFGAVSVRQGMVRALSEKGATGPGLINGGAYLIGGQVIEALRTGPRAFSFEREVLAPWIQREGAACVRTTGPFVDIGVPDDYERAALVLSGP